MQRRHDSGLPSSASVDSSRSKDITSTRAKRKMADDTTPTNKKPAQSRRRGSEREHIAVEVPAVDTTPRRLPKKSVHESSPFQTSPKVHHQPPVSPPSFSPELEEQYLPPEPESEAHEEQGTFSGIPAAYFETPDFLVANRYRPLSLIGTGAFSATYLAEDTYRDPLLKVTIKRMINRDFNISAIAEFKHFSYLQSSEPAPKHIVTAHERFFSEDGIANIVLEALDASRTIEIPPCTCLPAHSHLTCPRREMRFLEIAKQVLLGLYSLHQHEYIHGDVKPSNILYATSTSPSGPNTLKLIDLGNTIDPESRETVEEDFEFQTREYRAPEILLGAGPVSDRCDIWSVGMVLLEWFLGPQGRAELAEYRAKKALAGQRLAIQRESVTEPIMTCPGEPTREALVDRLIALFGSVKTYTNGAFYEYMYDEMSVTRQKLPYGISLTERSGIVREFLKENCSPGLSNFLSSMLAVDVRERWTAVDCLRDPWFIDTLLGELAFILEVPYSVQMQQQANGDDSEPAEVNAHASPFIKQQSHSPPSWVATESTVASTAGSSRESGRSSPVGREKKRVVKTPVRPRKVGRPITMPSSATTARTEDDDGMQLRLL